MFKRLLIANRGEIACRIMRTARRMGIETVAVYSDADRDALHVQQADRAVRIGPAPARDSYLRIDALIDAVRASGADAVHPGYGFLAENAEFAAACTDVCTFVGPSAKAIDAMGSKIEAKRIVAAAGAPVVPGYLGDQDPGKLAAAADDIGYPVLIKASAGGGGKGMRIVRAAKDFANALAAAKRESKAAFGDDAVLLEKYLTRPKHIEVQIMADRHGRTLYLFERDCSVQRRHQKVIEEAPAPTITAAQRASMGEAAVKAAAAIGYEGAGTIEFITEAGEFYFMEMNTRLQVEHPVTEAILGLDLVEWQLRVAAGEKLPFVQSDLRIRGHAIEARVYAENPRRKFLPSTGRLSHVRFPDDVRVDAGVASGGAVTMHYDPMIAKVIAHADTRDGAIERLRHALGECEIAGVEHNVAFLRNVLDDAAFRRGDYDTGLIEARGDALIPTDDPLPTLAAALLLLDAQRGDSPWQRGDAFRMNLVARQALRIRRRNETIVVDIVRDGGGLRVGVDGRTFVASNVDVATGRIRALVDGAPFVCAFARDGADLYVMRAGATEKFGVPVVDAASFEADTKSDGRAVAPMPGQIIALFVKAGDAVKRDQPILVLEAMKMEHTIVAPVDGKLERLSLSVGDRVTEGSELFQIA
ncbi:MAG TPA: acetyl-CoA carboxylase biotin carboxylase subunit [Pseudomonadales bacterium]|nr:acetyl-CoA carboxylase biotin carboxylase subunit [Pseudomonadales bacterium]